MSNQNKYKHGEWNVICDVCGFKKKASEVKLRWDGLYVCKEDWETRHPQEFLRTPKDDQSVPWTRSEPSDTFVLPSCPNNGHIGKADIGTADCMLAEFEGSVVDDTVPSGTFDGSL